MNADIVSFKLGDLVWHRLGWKAQGMITGILFRANGATYFVTWADTKAELCHHEMELSHEKVAAVL